MKIIVMRHGEASINAPSDDKRPLTSHGIEQASLVGNWLRSQYVIPEYVWVSPYLRAQQTWQAIEMQLDRPVAMTTRPDITPSGHAKQVAKEIHEFISSLGFQNGQSIQNKTLMIVSHLPLVGYLVEALCFEERAIMFGTADLACIEIDENREGKLIWQGAVSNYPRFSE